MPIHYEKCIQYLEFHNDSETFVFVFIKIHLFLLTKHKNLRPITKTFEISEGEVLRPSPPIQDNIFPGS